MLTYTTHPHTRHNRVIQKSTVVGKYIFMYIYVYKTVYLYARVKAYQPKCLPKINAALRVVFTVLCLLVATQGFQLMRWRLFLGRGRGNVDVPLHRRIRVSSRLDWLVQTTTDCAEVAYSCRVFAFICTRRQMVHYHVLLIFSGFSGKSVDESL